MRRIVPILVLLGLAALAAALAGIDGAAGARATAVATSGSFKLANSRDGQPIFAARSIVPGETAQGTVMIEGSGSAAALVLRRGAVVDVPGIGSGILSARLRLSVVDITTPAAPRSVYTGSLSSMPDQAVGEIQPGEARTFEFTATLPEGGEPSLQNAVQGASTTVAYAWVAEEASHEEASQGGGEEPSGGAEGSGGDGPSGGPGGGQADTSPTPGGEAGSVVGQDAVLDLTVLRVRRALWRGRLVVWTRCDVPCRVTVRGRARAKAAGRHRGARIHFAQKHIAAPRPQRLRIPIRGKLRRWLRQAPRPKQLRAKLRFIAVGTDGQRDVVRKKVRLRAGRR